MALSGAPAEAMLLPSDWHADLPLASRTHIWLPRADCPADCPPPADGTFSERLHAAAMQPGAPWCGWVDDIALPGTGAAKSSSPRAKARKPSRPGSSYSPMDKLAQGGEALQEMLADWTAPDPVAAAEAVALKAMTPEDRWAKSGGWGLNGWLAGTPHRCCWGIPSHRHVWVRLP